MFNKPPRAERHAWWCEKSENEIGGKLFHFPPTRLINGNIISQESSKSYQFTVEKTNSLIVLQEINNYNNTAEVVLFTANGGNLSEINSDNAFYIRDIEAEKKIKLIGTTPNSGRILP